MSVIMLDSAAGGDGASRYPGNFNPNVVAAQSPSGRTIYRTVNVVNSQWIYTYPTPVTSPLLGFYQRASAATDGQAIFQPTQFRGPTGTIHVHVGVDAAGAVVARLGGGTGTVLATSANGVIGFNVWHHWEVRCTVADSGGRVEVWIDGVQVINFTGDTRNGGADTTIASVMFGRTGGATGTDFSDLRYGDGTTPLGVTTVWLSLPNGNGNTSGLNGSDGNQVNNFELVDEATPNGDTDYVFGSTEGVYDTYALGNLPAGSWDVLAVQTTFSAKTSDGGPKFVRPRLRSGGSEATGTSRSVPASYATLMQVFENNPLTASPWTKAEVDALEAGPEVRNS